MTDPSTIPEQAKPRRSRIRLWVALALTPLVIVLPSVGALVGYAVTGEVAERDLNVGTTVTFAVICALAWAGLGIHRLMARVDRSAGSNDGATIEDPDIIRAVLSQYDLACAKCGYSLRGLPPGPCPECREPIRVRVNSTDALRPLTRIVLLSLTACTLRTALGVYYLVQIFGFWRSLAFGGAPLPPGYQFRLQVGTAAQGVALIALSALVIPVIGWIRARGPSQRVAARWRIAWMSVAVLALVSLFDLARSLFWWF